MLKTPVNSKDTALQALPQRVVSLNTNFISLASPYLEFVYGGINDTAFPTSITVTAQLAGNLQGVVEFPPIDGLKEGTTFEQVGNTLIIDPSKFAGYYITIQATLDFNGATYTSNPVVISKRYTSLSTRLTRTFDVISSDSDGKNYILPTDANTLELYNGSIKLTKDVVYGILGESVLNYKTVDGLTLTINKNTGAISLSDASTSTKWDKDSATFVLTATIGLTTFSSTYTINKLREGGVGVDPTVAPTPTGLKVSGGTSFIFVSVGVPDYTVGHGHSKTKIYALSKKQYPETEEQIFANATPKSEFTGTIGSFESAADTTWLVWASWVTIDGFEGNTAGPVLASSSLDTTALVDAVLAENNKQFEVIKTPEVRFFGTPQQITIPAGVYAKAAFITDGFITNAKIADAAIDSAKILNLDAIHLTAGDGTIGGVLKSGNYNYLVDANGVPRRGSNQNGWAIFPDGSVDFAAADIRGQLTAGQIDGTGLSIKRRNSDGTYTTILDSGLSIQQQINNYAVNASAGITLNFDPTCSNTTAWNSENIATITDGTTGNKVLAGSNGEHLFEGITINKAYTINYDPKKRYQLSALIRRTAGAVKGDVHLGLLEIDTNNTARYDWGGYLAGKFAVNNLTTEFKRYYAYFSPGDLHTGVSKVIVHTVLGYSPDGTGTGGGRVEIQDINLEDISLGHAIQYQTVTTAAIDTTVKTTAVLNTTQSNMGINSWVVNRYSVSTTAGTIPEYTFFANVTPVQTVTFADAASLTGSTIFGADYSNYIGVATSNVYCETATTWTTTVSGDDGHNLYVNGISVIKSGNARAATAVTINFPKGWSTVEAVWCEQAGGDGFGFATKISATTGVKEMWAFVGGTLATNGIAASAATTSTWSGTINIPYDKIFATDATTTLGFNPSFELWTGAYPDKWNSWGGTAPVKETTDTRFGTNAVKYIASGEAGLGIERSTTWTQPMPKGTFISGTMDVNLLTVTRGLPGILVRLFTKVVDLNNPALNTYVDTIVQPTNATNTWQRVPFTARVGLAQEIYGVQVFIIGSWSGFTSGKFTGTVVFDGLTFAFFDNTIDNKDITIDGDGKLTGTGAKDVVVNNKIIKIDDNGKLTGVGTDNVVVNNGSISINTVGELRGIGGTEYVVVNNKIIKVNETTGVLEGVGTESVVVNNSIINVDGDGKLTGTGATNVVVNNQKITVSGTGTLTGIGTANVVVDNSKIVVGGTNLIRNGGNFNYSEGWQTTGSGLVSISNTIKYGTKNTLQIKESLGTTGGIRSATIMELKPDTEYIVSAIVKGNKAISGGVNKILNIENWTTGNSTARSPGSLSAVNTDVTTAWKQIYQVFTTLPDDGTGGIVYCRFSFSPIISAQLNIAYVQLEQGNKITDWSPCPDDILSEIKNVADNSIAPDKVIKSQAANILPADGEFTIQTPNFDVPSGGNGVLISARGIVGRKTESINGVNTTKETFAIDTNGDASFRGTVVASYMHDGDNKFVIDLKNRFISISV